MLLDQASRTKHVLQRRLGKVRAQGHLDNDWGDGEKVSEESLDTVCGNDCLPRIPSAPLDYGLKLVTGRTTYNLLNIRRLPRSCLV